VLRILLVTPEVPYPPTQGASLRNFYILKGLALNHEVSLFSASSSDVYRGERNATPLNDICRNINVVQVPERTQTTRLSRLLSLNTPDIAHRFDDEALIEAFVEHLQHVESKEKPHKPYDVIQIEGLEMAHLSPVIRRYSPSSRLVFDAHNAETELQRRVFDTELATVGRWPAAAYSFLQVRRLGRYESWACESADAVTTVSNADAKQLAKYVHGKSPVVIPNCIDIEKYIDLSGKGVEGFDILYTGKMDYRPNVDAVLWFSDEIWPKIVTERPDTNWAIVGQKPHSRLAQLGSTQGVTVTGYVDHVEPYLAGARVVILPLRMGSGTRLKLLEALASSKAVVSTTQGAEGFPNIGDKAIVIEDDPDRFANSVLSLLESKQKREEIGMAGQQYAQKYDWRRIIPRFEEVYRALDLDPANDA
jgi:glycosyltransferase involved in cell wall biosynthesis